MLNIGEKIVNLRKENNLTQDELANKLNVSRQSISKWESGLSLPEISNLLLISEIFNCTIDSLLLEETTPLEVPKESFETFGERLIYLRKKHHMSQELLADALEVSRQSIFKYEKNLIYPDLDKIIKISNLYNCSIDYLLKEKENINEQFIEEKKEEQSIRFARLEIIFYLIYTVVSFGFSIIFNLNNSIDLLIIYKLIIGYIGTTTLISFINRKVNKKDIKGTLKYALVSIFSFFGLMVSTSVFGGVIQDHNTYSYICSLWGAVGILWIFDYKNNNSKYKVMNIIKCFYLSIIPLGIFVLAMLGDTATLMISLQTIYYFINISSLLLVVFFIVELIVTREKFSIDVKKIIFTILFLLMVRIINSIYYKFTTILNLEDYLLLQKIGIDNLTISLIILLFFLMRKKKIVYKNIILFVLSIGILEVIIQNINEYNPVSYFELNAILFVNEIVKRKKLKNE